LSEELPEWITDLDEAFELLMKHKGKIKAYWEQIDSSEGVKARIFYETLVTLRKYDLVSE